jgi:hypothetical protein
LEKRIVEYRITDANKELRGNTSAVVAYCHIKGEKLNIPIPIIMELIWCEDSWAVSWMLHPMK